MRPCTERCFQNGKCIFFHKYFFFYRKHLCLYTAAPGNWKEILMGLILVESEEFDGFSIIFQENRRMDVKTEQQSSK